MHQGSVTGGANHVQGPSPLPKSSSTAAVAEQTNTEQSEPASRPARDEEDKVAVGNGPTSSVVKTWTDPVATYSLQQAIADQPASSLAQPIALGEGDPANQRPSEAAHQPAASAGTGTITPAAQCATPALPNDKTVAVGANKQKPTAQYSMKTFLLWLLQHKALLLRLAVGLLQDRLTPRLLQTGVAVGPPHLPEGKAAVATARTVGTIAGTLRLEWCLLAQSLLM